MGWVNRVICVLLLFQVIGISSAEQVDSPLSITVTCTNSTYANLSYAKYIRNSEFIFLEERAMTKNGPSYNYTIQADENTKTGTMEYGYHCDVNGNDQSSGNQIFISYMGEEISTGQGVIYVVLMVGLVIVFGLTVYGAWVFPWKNPRNEEGLVISLNDLKYLKIFFWVLAYLEFLFISLILRNLSGYLVIDGTYSFFNFVYNLLLILLIPFFPLLVFFTIMVWITDKKTQKSLQRGIPVR